MPVPEGVHVHLTVNGDSVDLLVDPRTSVLDLLRERLGLTGAKKGCDHGQCGACTILVDGRRTNSCLLLVVAADGSAIRTVEGLDVDGGLHPLQRAFVDHDAYQCGYCTPGQLCSALGVLEEVGHGWPSAVTDDDRAVTLDEAEVRERMSGNLCRCGAYANLVAAILDAGRVAKGETDR